MKNIIEKQLVEWKEELAKQKHGHTKKAVSRGGEMQVHQSATSSQVNLRKKAIKQNQSTEYEQFGEILKENFDLDAKY